jgi:hypothetical protein
MKFDLISYRTVSVSPTNYANKLEAISKQNNECWPVDAEKAMLKICFQPAVIKKIFICLLFLIIKFKKWLRGTLK